MDGFDLEMVMIRPDYDTEGMTGSLRARADLIGIVDGHVGFGNLARLSARTHDLAESCQPLPPAETGRPLAPLDMSHLQMQVDQETSIANGRTDNPVNAMRVSAPPLPPLLEIPVLRAPSSEELERRRLEDQGLLQPLEHQNSDFWDTLSSDSDQSTDPEDFSCPPPPPPF